MLNKHRALVVLTCATFLVTLGACETEVDNQPAAEVGEAVEGTTAPAAPDLEEVTVDVIKDQSRIDWVGAKVTRQHDGGFESFDGSLTFAGETPQRVEFTIDMASVWSDTERLTGHLKTPDFFDVENFPTAHFESTSIRNVGSAANDSFEITGNLDLRGTTNSITFPATVDMSGDTIETSAEFTIDRQLWGIAYEGAPDNLVRDEVLIKLDLSFPKPGSEATGDDTADPEADEGSETDATGIEI